MKLDTKAMRYLAAEDWRVLTAVELGSKNHEVVPTPLIIQLSHLRGGSGVHKCISTLAKVGLIAKVKNAKYDGYRLTYGGLDYLAMHTHSKHKTIYSVGNQIGVGKESDILVVAGQSGVQHVLKIHRLGRISFRTVKNNRDYLRNRHSGSWMYMSRLAAMKEFTFMKALHENGFNVPLPIAHNRHTIVMELIDAFPLRQIKEVPDPAGLYCELISIVLRLASVGLIHGDFNEFNILIKEDQELENLLDRAVEAEAQMDGSSSLASPRIRLTPVIIDFPQMVSVDHPDAAMYFDRDINCIKTFFERRFHFVSNEPGPYFKEAREKLAANASPRLDVAAEASGFSRKMAKELELYMKDVGAEGVGESSAVMSGESSDDDESVGETLSDQDELQGSEDAEHKMPPIEVPTPASALDLSSFSGRASLQSDGQG